MSREQGYYAAKLDGEYVIIEQTQQDVHLPVRFINYSESQFEKISTYKIDPELFLIDNFLAKGSLFNEKSIEDMSKSLLLSTLNCYVHLSAVGIFKSKELLKEIKDLKSQLSQSKESNKKLRKELKASSKELKQRKGDKC